MGRDGGQQLAHSLWYDPVSALSGIQQGKVGGASLIPAGCARRWLPQTERARVAHSVEPW